MRKSKAVGFANGDNFSEIFLVESMASKAKDPSKLWYRFSDYTHFRRVHAPNTNEIREKRRRHARIILRTIRDKEVGAKEISKLSATISKSDRQIARRAGVTTALTNGTDPGHQPGFMYQIISRIINATKSIESSHCAAGSSRQFLQTEKSTSTPPITGRPRGNWAASRKVFVEPTRIHI